MVLTNGDQGGQPMVRWTGRRGARAAVAAVVGLALTGFGMVSGDAAVGATAAADLGSHLHQAANTSRSALAAQAALQRVAELDGVALAHAQAMADRGGLFHNPSLGQQVTGWRALAENVGMGVDVESIHQAFLDSPSHRANLLDGRYSEIGIGVAASADGRVWAVEVFRQPVATVAPPVADSAAAAAPAPAPAPARRPVVRPQPAARPAAAAVSAPEPVVDPEPAPAVEAPVVIPDTVPLDLTPQRPYVAAPVEPTSPTAAVVTPADEATPRGRLPLLASLAAALWALVALRAAAALGSGAAVQPLRRLRLRTA